MARAEPAVVETPPLPFPERPCGCALGVFLIFYGLVNVGLWFKFTPVYVAAKCGTKAAQLDRFRLDETFQVGLGITVTCDNPNNYAVTIKRANPGHVWIGVEPNITIGTMELEKGSTLPQKGEGSINAYMDAHLAPAATLQLAPHFLSRSEIPLYLELQFDVGVSLQFGLMSFGTTAPFKKKCGMYLGGLWSTGSTRVGPLICRDSFDQVKGHLLHIGEGDAGDMPMSFSAAQMDPDRVALGENLKNVSIVGTVILCFAFGSWLLYRYLKARRKRLGGMGYDQVWDLRRFDWMRRGGAVEQDSGPEDTRTWGSSFGSGSLSSVMRFMSCNTCCSPTPAPPRTVLLATTPRPAFSMSWSRGPGP